MAGEVATIEPALAGDFGTLMEWADKHRRMKVRTNAETPADCRTARQFGAEGIGLCRTEHMFFDAERISAVRQMILAESEDGRRAALAKLLPAHSAAISAEIFEVMRGLPVTIRLLDPPLHEFLPHADAEFAELSDALGIGVDTLRRRAQELTEVNPMLGHRGCRLGITYPEIYEMQVRAIFEAACEVAANARRGDRAGDHDSAGRNPAGTGNPARAGRPESPKRCSPRRAARWTYLVGTMIELPRAALMAGEIAEEAMFFSFGTNDLTQTTLGLSRDDSGRFLGVYVEKGIFPRDPFVSLDIDGVGQLVQIAADRGTRNPFATSSWASAENTAAIRLALLFVKRSASITSAPRRSACRSRASRRRRRHWASRPHRLRQPLSVRISKRSTVRRSSPAAANAVLARSSAALPSGGPGSSSTLE